MNKKIALVMIGLLFIVIMAASAFIEGNLIDYSVYYASHLPHRKGRHPAPILILENVEGLEYFDKQRDPNYEFDFDGAPRISNDKYGLTLFTDGIVFVEYSTPSTDYKFGAREKLHSVFSYNKEKTKMTSIDINQVNRKQLWKKIDNFLKPFIDNQPKPKINLQWLFNMRYENRFK